MNFKYISFNEKLEDHIENEQDIIYIFPNNNYKNKLQKTDMNIFGRDALYLTLSEFKERLFTTDRFVLKEEKRTLLFYEALSTKMKEEQNIKGYYDVIDYGENFLSFYKELREYKVEQLDNIEVWQQERYQDLEIIKKRYEDLLDRYHYITPDRVPSMENFSSDIFSDYKKIVFINIINFTPLERDFILKLNEKFEVDFLLQMSQGDFDEEKLEFKSLSLPQDIEGEISIYQVPDNSMEAINFIENLSEETKIFSCDFDRISYDKLLNKELIKKRDDVPLSETRLFKFIDLIYEIIESSMGGIRGRTYKTSTLLHALEDRDFRIYFGFGYADYDYFMSRITDRNQKYLDREWLAENTDDNNRDFAEKVEGFMIFIEDLAKEETLKGLVDFFSNPEKFNYLHFDEEKYEDLIAKYFEVLSEVESNEMLHYKPNWQEYFENVNSSLLKLFLKYMRHKKAKELVSSRYSINNFDDSYTVDEEIILLDTSANTLPKKSKVGFLLTNKQKEELGMMTIERAKEIERYHFYRTVFTNNNIGIYSIKNEDKNIDSSPFVDELMLNYNLDFKENPYEKEDFSGFVKTLLKPVKDREYREVEEDIIPKANLELLRDKDSFQLGSYDFDLLNACPYRYFMQNIARLDKHNREVEYKLDPRIIGIMIHEVFERIGYIKREALLKGDYFLSEGTVRDIFNTTFEIHKNFIPKNYQNYYREIMFPIFMKGVEKFYELLSYRFGDKTLTSFAQEKSKTEEIYKKDNIPVKLSGRADLIIEDQAEKHIVDYKTGDGHPSQLDFYSILYYGEGDVAQKFIYNAWEGEIKDDEVERKKILMKDDVIEAIDAFMSDSIYRRTDKEGNCRNCTYIDICRQRWANE